MKTGISIISPCSFFWEVICCLGCLCSVRLDFDITKILESRFPVPALVYWFWMAVVNPVFSETYFLFQLHITFPSFGKIIYIMAVFSCLLDQNNLVYFAHSCSHQCHQCLLGKCWFEVFLNNALIHDYILHCQVFLLKM